MNFILDLDDLVSLPRLAIADLKRTIIAEKQKGKRLLAYWGQQNTNKSKNGLELILLFIDGEKLTPYLIEIFADQKSLPSSTPEVPEIHLFERLLYEEHGIFPDGHPWPKPVRQAKGDIEFFRMQGEEIHEVGVGPVHAGIIEPGHFRFQCHGEIVHHLEITLGYQHRGIEAALVGGPHKRTLPLMEVAAGDTTIAHSMAYAQIVENLTHSPVAEPAQYLRLLMLELERLANHVGDLGALANDVGYLPTASFCGRIRGDFLNLSALICGSRLGRNMIHPGGVHFAIASKKEFVNRLENAYRDTKGAVKLFFETPSVLARLQNVGILSESQARDLGIVGLAARASNLPIDSRQYVPLYKNHKFTPSVHHTGDVFSRASVRYEECKQSVHLIREWQDHLSDSLPASSLPRYNELQLPARKLAISLVEGWRGEVCHVASTDEKGKFASYKIFDPSFKNWTGLAMVLRGQQISDFPLCNKSFNLSYCGFDL